MTLYNTETKVLAELYRIEQRIGVREEGIKSVCPDNNRPYVTIAWSPKGSCIKKEGRSGVVFPTPEVAWALWMTAFREYARGRNGSISWRKHPTLSEVHDTIDPEDTWGKKELKGYIVWGRLHINQNGEDRNVL